MQTNSSSESNKMDQNKGTVLLLICTDISHRQLLHRGKNAFTFCQWRRYQTADKIFARDAQDEQHLHIPFKALYIVTSAWPVAEKSMQAELCQ